MNRSDIIRHWLSADNSESAQKKDEIIISDFEVVGTGYEGRSDRIEHLRSGDTVVLKREPNNAHDPGAIGVYNKQGASLGHLSRSFTETASFLLDNGYVEIIKATVNTVIPKSQRSARAKSAKLSVDITLKPSEHFMRQPLTVVCCLEGDHLSCWQQEIEVLYSVIPFESAKLFFELWNRFHGEYKPDQNEIYYIGLDGFREDVESARQRMRAERQYNPSDMPNEDESFPSYVGRKIAQEPQRYQCIESFYKTAKDSYYEDNDTDDMFFMSFFNVNGVFTKTYYRIDYAPLSQEEYLKNSPGWFHHWYRTAELFKDDVPVDLDDPDTISIFGTGKFEALADLSYGC